jgi:CheY-like chemotaxis protein
LREQFSILIADDDVDDQQLMRTGLKECRVKVEVNSVFNGIQLMDYLLHRHDFKHIRTVPDLVLLDLNMPLMDGFDALTEIRRHASLKGMAVYVISTSRATVDHDKALELGASGFYTKGSSSKEILRIMKAICRECFETVPGSI